MRHRHYLCCREGPGGHRWSTDELSAPLGTHVARHSPEPLRSETAPVIRQLGRRRADPRRITGPRASRATRSCPPRAMTARPVRPSSTTRPGRTASPPTAAAGVESVGDRNRRHPAAIRLQLGSDQRRTVQRRRQRQPRLLEVDPGRQHETAWDQTWLPRPPRAGGPGVIYPLPSWQSGVESVIGSTCAVSGTWRGRRGQRRRAARPASARRSPGCSWPRWPGSRSDRGRDQRQVTPERRS